MSRGPVKWSESRNFFATPLTVAHQAPLSMGFSRQEHWSGLPLLSPGDLPNPGINPPSPALQADSLPSEPQGKPCYIIHQGKNLFESFSMNCDLYIGSFSLQKEAFSSLLIRNATIHTTDDYRKHLTFAMTTILYLPSLPSSVKKN